MSAYDAAAPSFDRHRPLPVGVPEAIRTTALAALHWTVRPRLLDLGAGTGRIGRPFVMAGNDYVGVDLSLGMLREFMARRGEGGRAPRLVQADGGRLPFGDARFDAVMLIQVFGGMRGWQRVVDEARRVLRPDGALVIGGSVRPVDGLDAQMKRHLASLLGEMNVRPRGNPRDEVQRYLASEARSDTSMIAAAWSAGHTPREFIDRHRIGARFSALPEAIKASALIKLADWAAAAFGSLDVVFSERHEFELRVFKFR